MTERARLHVLPAGAWVETDKGTTLLEAVEDAGFDIETLCGGRGICRRCQVVAPGLPTPKHLEREAFDAGQLAAGYRLACLWKVDGDLEVEIVPLEDFAHKAFSGLADWPEIEPAPEARRASVRLSPPSLEDQRSDSERLRQALGGERLELAYDVALELPGVLREARWRVTATTVGNRVVAVERAHLRPPVGVAVDLGTTSVAAMLVNLRTGTAADVGAHSNSQGRFGAEVMSRIEHAGTPEGLRALQEAVVGDVNRILAEACERTAVRPEDVVSMTVVGNTTMCHLFLGLSPAHIGAAPFVGVTSEGVTVEAARLGLDLHPRAEVYVLPSVAGFVGADTVGALLAARLDDSAETALLMDIGTNGELVLAHDGELYTASAPAGPAFEGGQIRHGMRAATGAIERVTVSEAGELAYTTIGQAPARGICGSGLVDACAELFRVGLVDAGGRLRSLEEVEAASASPAARALARRVRSDAGRRELLVADAAETATGEAIVLTQHDIRQFQLVKAAIGAGAATLLADRGLDAGDLDAVYLAGSFGSHIGLDAARRTGLVPEVPLDRLHDVGNAALEGARMALLDSRHRAVAEATARRAHHVELSGRADFSERFLAAVAFAPRGAPARAR